MKTQSFIAWAGTFLALFLGLRNSAPAASTIDAANFNPTTRLRLTAY